MKCMLCRNGDTKAGTTTVTLTRGALTFVVRNVPAQVCENCGEAYVDERVSADLLTAAEQAAKAGVQVTVRDYAAA